LYIYILGGAVIEAVNSLDRGDLRALAFYPLYARQFGVFSGRSLVTLCGLQAALF
jgi:hypothetical protein